MGSTPSINTMELLPSRKANVDDFWSVQDHKSANHEPTSQHEHESVGDYTVSIKRNPYAERTTMREIKKVAAYSFL